MLNDDVWSTLLNLWPLMLVLIGLDGLINRNGVVGPSLLIGLGVIFLLNNFGYLVLDVWQLILSLWPVLLIAFGFDILIGRRSWLLSLIGVMVVLAILVGAIGLMGSTAYAAAGQEIRYPLEGVERAELDFSIPVGSTTIDATSETEVLLVGQVPDGGGLTVQEQFLVQNGTAALKISGEGAAVAVPGMTSPYRWDFQVAPEVPLTINISQGAGAVNIDLSELLLSDLNASLGAGQIVLALPEGQSFTAHLSGGVGQLVVLVPEGLGVRITSGTALAAFSAPEAYEHSGAVYTSPNYASAEERVELELDLAVGSVVVKEK
jgi:hypothetical protein